MPKGFRPHHINVTKEDLQGNNGIGRYLFLPGSDGRAKQIAEHFADVKTKSHTRGYHFYSGTITSSDKTIDVATISSGMGCPSMEIILHELYQMGGRRFLRIGTAGSLQPERIKSGDIINAQASVRDEQTTSDYVPLSVPAIASPEFTLAISQAAKKLGMSQKLHTGIVHCKSSFYAKEFGSGPQAEANHAFMNTLTRYGVLASEMETAALFIQSQFYDHELKQQGTGPAHRVLCGAILGILAFTPYEPGPANEENLLNIDLIDLGLETIKNLARVE